MSWQGIVARSRAARAKAVSSCTVTPFMRISTRKAPTWISLSLPESTAQNASCASS
jgi:hypothetical protein